jgi:hypothetical protein
MDFLLMEKMTAARTRIWPAKGHYMGLNSGVFWQMENCMGTDFRAGEPDAFTGVFCAFYGE